MLLFEHRYSVLQDDWAFPARRVGWKPTVTNRSHRFYSSQLTGWRETHRPHRMTLSNIFSPPLLIALQYISMM